MNFRDKYWFLSNMFETLVPLVIDGTSYNFRNAEAAFQAQKNPSLAAQFANLNGFEAKKLGRRIPITVPNWNNYRDIAMRNAVSAKFNNNVNLMNQLKNITEEIVEDNTWGDKYWGRSNGIGENKLGQILMSIRDSNKS